MAAQPAERKATLIENIGAPGIVTGVSSGSGQAQYKSNWHLHDTVQIIGVREGLLRVKSETMSHVLNSRLIAMVPAGLPHFEQPVTEKTSTWMISISPERAAHHGSKIRILNATNLMVCLCERIVRDGALKPEAKTPEQKRLAMTFLDELNRAVPAEDLGVTFPDSPRLMAVAISIINNPNDKSSIDHWAETAGMSRRSFTQHFAEQTGMSFAVWRQRSKMQAALKFLSEGKRVREIADLLGFASASGFIEVFKENFGDTPTNYLKKR